MKAIIVLISSIFILGCQGASSDTDSNQTHSESTSTFENRASIGGPFSPFFQDPAILTEGRVIVNAYDVGRVYSLSKDNGNLQWTFGEQEELDQKVQFHKVSDHGNELYLPDTNLYFSRIDKTTGRLLERQDIFLKEEDRVGAQMVFFENDTFFLKPGVNTVKLETKEKHSIVGSDIFPDPNSTFYYVLNGTVVSAVDPSQLNSSENTTVWEYTKLSTRNGSIKALIQDRLFVYDGNSQIHVLDTSTGEVLSHLEGNEHTYFTKDPDQEIVYMTIDFYDGGSIRAVNLTNFETIWENSPEAFRIYGPLSFDDAHIYAGGVRLYKLDRLNGEMIDFIPITQWIVSPPITDENNVYFGVSTGHYYAYDKESLTEVWSFDVANER